MDTAETKIVSDADLAAIIEGRATPFVRNEDLQRARKQPSFEAGLFRKQAKGSPAGESEGKPTGTDGSSGAETAKRAAQKASDQGFSPDAPPRPIDIEAEKRAAFEAGKAEAERAHAAALEDIRAKATQTAQWEADQSLSAAVDPLRAITARLTEAVADAEETLARVLEDTVHQIASERAGVAINASPPAFVARIASLAREIAQGGADSGATARVGLNPEDLRAISPHLEPGSTSEEPIEGALYYGDDSLARGDVQLTFGDVTCSDRLLRQAQ